MHRSQLLKRPLKIVLTCPPVALRRAWLCSEFLNFNTMERLGGDSPEAWAEELAADEPMCLPGEIIYLWTRYLIWNGGKPLEIGFMDTYTLQKLAGADDEVRRAMLEELEAKFRDCSQLILPMFAAGHWVLLQANQIAGTIHFADSLRGPCSLHACCSSLRAGRCCPQLINRCSQPNGSPQPPG